MLCLVYQKCKHKVLGLIRCLHSWPFVLYAQCRLGNAELWLILYIFNNNGLCPVAFMVNKLKYCEILSCVALSLPMWHQYTKRVNTFRLVDPHSYNSISSSLNALSCCIDTEAEKFIGWHVSDCRFSITQVFELEKSGIVTNSIFWPFSPEKARQNTWACNIEGMTIQNKQQQVSQAVCVTRWLSQSSCSVGAVSSFTNLTYSLTKHQWVYREEPCSHTLADCQQSTHVDTSLK